MISESVVVWKMPPRYSKSVRSLGVFTRLPLWARARVPLTYFSVRGWAFSRRTPPVVA